MLSKSDRFDVSHWTDRRGHREWLTQQADALFDFFDPAFVDPAGGFLDLDRTGTPAGPEMQVHALHTTARAVHCFAIGSLLGRPVAPDVVDHGLRTLWERHRDQTRGGYFWSFAKEQAIDDTKQGYGHAFVLLAAASARIAGHPLADRVLADVSDVLDRYFWEETHGAIAEEFTADWRPIDGGTYRGQNSNMHLTEALMAAYEATGETEYLNKAIRIAERVINQAARSRGWRVAEHFLADWTIVDDYSHDNAMLRPSGTTPGHWFEWSRLLLQLWVISGQGYPWMPEAAQALFRNAMAYGWDADNGGYYYTLDWQNRPLRREKLWWPAAEAAAAAHALNALCPHSDWEAAYRQTWDLIEGHYIDSKYGGWHEELSEDLRPAFSIFPGKSDLYHALQACLTPLFPVEGTLTRAIQNHLFSEISS
ncbi:AGE family epimerase/isomerase [Marinibacterium sp. SX1]|uniref:AGE family epimerase/isomerase n=1 Tax=Marinibacterium sp. SX1 TaxID=3388424 RepID=UPI003D1795A0